MRAPLQTYVLALLLAGCSASQPPATTEGEPRQVAGQAAPNYSHAPPFAQVPYEPFSRADAVAIAEQEWRLFGNRVDDNPPPPGGYFPLAADDPSRAPGQWERIGEYWWLGQDASNPQSAWTGMHDENGQQFDESQADYYAWSAAFISYIMRTAGAGPRFPYASSHFAYIDIAKDMSLGLTSGWVVMAEPVDGYAPVPGDLICYSREKKRRITYNTLPQPHFAAHCDMVVAQGNQQLTVIGGNVDHAVTMKHIPVTPGGQLADPGGDVLDTRYPWLVVLRIAYDR